MRIPPDSEKSNLIRIEGDPQGVQQAKRELLELASRMVSPGLRPAGAPSCWATCWAGFRGSVVGAPGTGRDFPGLLKAPGDECVSQAESP